MNATNTRITPLHSTFFNLSEIEREFDEGISAFQNTLQAYLFDIY